MYLIAVASSLLTFSARLANCIGLILFMLKSLGYCLNLLSRSVFDMPGSSTRSTRNSYIVIFLGMNVASSISRILNLGFYPKVVALPPWKVTPKGLLVPWLGYCNWKNSCSSFPKCWKATIC